MKPSIRFRVDFGPSEAIGPGKIALLEAIEQSGSISQAARDLGMSYRRGWQLVESLNSSFRAPLTAASKGGRGGGGARLTPLGREAIRAYRRFEAELQKQAERHFRLLAQQARSARHRGKVLRLSAR
jgi:molybdate transport system regulatory protein